MYALLFLTIEKSLEETYFHGSLREKLLKHIFKLFDFMNIINETIPTVFIFKILPVLDFESWH